MAKLKNQFTINTDEETAAQIMKLANHYQRKPAELLRLILAPALRDLWVQMQQEQHPENNTAPTLARFQK